MYLRLFLGRSGAAALWRSAERHYMRNEEGLKRMKLKAANQGLMRTITT